MMKEEKVAQKGCTEKVEQESSGWHYWKPGEYFAGTPEGLHPEDIVEVALRDGSRNKGAAYGYAWPHAHDSCDIVAYRVVEEHKEGVVV